MSQIIKFQELSTEDLIVDATYKGREAKNLGADPLTKLLNCGNEGGY